MQGPTGGGGSDERGTSVCDRFPKRSGPEYHLESILHRNVQQFQGGLVFKAHRPLYLSALSSLGLRDIKKKKNEVKEEEATTLLHQGVGGWGLGLRLEG